MFRKTFCPSHSSAVEVEPAQLRSSISYTSTWCNAPLRFPELLPKSIANEGKRKFNCQPYLYVLIMLLSSNMLPNGGWHSGGINSRAEQCNVTH